MKSLTSPAPEQGLIRPWILAACIIAAASLSIHVVMLQVLQIPYPDFTGIGRWGLVLVLMRILALFAAYRLMLPCLAGRGLAQRIVLLAILDAAIAGKMRSAIMEGVTSLSVLNPLIGLALGLIESLIVAALVVILVRGSRRVPMLMVWSVVSTALLTLVISPFVRRTGAALMAPAQPPVFLPPYGPGVLTVSYVTFLESVAAVIALTLLVAPRLSATSGRNMLQMVTLVLLLRGTLVMQLLFPWLMNAPVGSAMLHTSQFFLQDLALAAMVWVRWRMIGLPHEASNSTYERK